MAGGHPRDIEKPTSPLELDPMAMTDTWQVTTMNDAINKKMLLLAIFDRQHQRSQIVGIQCCNRKVLGKSLRANSGISA